MNPTETPTPPSEQGSIKEPIQPATVPPRQLQGAYPHFTVGILPYDPFEKTACLLYRGANVRSAPNRWSIPTGLLEHGESFDVSMKRELLEELGIPSTAFIGDIRLHTVHRNIPGDGYDWVIGVWSIPVKNLSEHCVNMEPDKHDKIWVACMRDLLTVHLSDAEFAIDDSMRASLISVLRELR